MMSIAVVGPDVPDRFVRLKMVPENRVPSPAARRFSLDKRFV
jgi:hypothetical protein